MKVNMFDGWRLVKCTESEVASSPAASPPASPCSSSPPVLAGPVLASAARMAVTTAFLVEFLSDGRYPLLSRLTDTPARRRVTVRGMEFETFGESRGASLARARSRIRA